MDIVYLFISLLLIITGIIGCFFPIIPGPLTGWFGFVFLNQIEFVEINTNFLIITFIISFSTMIIDYIIPIIGTKIFGGSKKGMIGASLGLLVGIIFMGPFGLLIGPFLGALIGELINDRSIILAFKASLGTILGLLGGFILKFSVSCSFFAIYFCKLWKINELIF